MSRRRIILVHLLLVIIVFGSAYAVFYQREIWPFSPYPMYSWLEKKRSVRRLQLYGVPRTAGPEFPIVAFDHLEPLDDARLYVALNRLHRTRQKRALRSSLADLLQRYEGVRLAGRHEGPPLQGIRLYELLWLDIDPRAFEAQGPDRRRLIGEFQQRTGH